MGAHRSHSGSTAAPRSESERASAESTSREATLRRAEPAAASTPSNAATTTAAASPAGVREPRGAPAEKVFTARWGGAPGELGRKAAEESSPEGPMSYAVDSRGRALVLDQVNARVEVFEPGREPKTIHLPGDTFQDIALTKKDGLVVLDRLTTASVAYVDADGKLTHEVGLEGKGVPEAGNVTGLFQRDDGTWVEVSHANLVRVADADENPDLERPILQGRPTFDGTRILRASKSGSRAAYIAEKRGDEPARALTRIEFDIPVYQLLSLDTDAHGRIYLGASLVEERPEAPFDVLRSGEMVVVLSPSGTELSRIELPENTGAEESFRRIQVGADGFLYHLSYADEGATLWRVKP